MAERIVSQYKRLRMYLNSLPSNLNILNRHQQKPRLSSLDLESSQEQQRTGLAKQHRSSHEMIQKRVLQGAETTVRLLMDSCISVEEARADLKATIGSYQEVLVRIRLGTPPDNECRYYVDTKSRFSIFRFSMIL